MNRGWAQPARGFSCSQYALVAGGGVSRVDLHFGAVGEIDRRAGEDDLVARLDPIAHFDGGAESRARW